MASGKTHAKITTLAIIPVGLVAFAASLDLAIAGAASAGCLVGLKIHPDLDLSRSWLWVPYSKSLRHRSPWSHFPVLGTIGRLLYLVGVTSLLIAPASVLWLALGGWINPPMVSMYQVGMGVSAIWGLMVADGLHWLVDIVSSRWKQQTKKRRRVNRQRVFG